MNLIKRLICKVKGHHGMQLGYTPLSMGDGPIPILSIDRDQVWIYRRCLRCGLVDTFGTPPVGIDVAVDQALKGVKVGEPGTRESEEQLVADVMAILGMDKD